jgi:hypothetical protein
MASPAKNVEEHQATTILRRLASVHVLAVVTGLRRRQGFSNRSHARDLDRRALNRLDGLAVVMPREEIQPVDGA